MILTDDSPDPRLQPTRHNILNAMRWLVDGARKHDSLAFHCMYASASLEVLISCADSGHGGQTPDNDGDEIDGYDEGWNRNSSASFVD